VCGGRIDSSGSGVRLRSGGGSGGFDIPQAYHRDFLCRSAVCTKSRLFEALFVQSPLERISVIGLQNPINVGVTVQQEDL
jgi:hypothetical protein